MHACEAADSGDVIERRLPDGAREVRYVCVREREYIYCSCVCMYICLRVCICMYVCMYVCMYICMHARRLCDRMKAA